jgi:hypothetical protein
MEILGVVQTLASIVTAKCYKLFREIYVIDKYQYKKTNNDQNLTYGEIEYWSFKDLLDYLNPKIGDVFIDLGHGNGKALIAAALLYGDKFSAVCGVEIITTLFQDSIYNIELYNNLITSYYYLDYFHNDCELIVENGNFLESSNLIDWASAGINKKLI